MADGDSYQVDLDQLDDAITTMQKFGAAVETILTEVEANIAALHLSWSSEAATAQRAAHDRWVTGAAQMRDNLEELRAVARNAHLNYTGAITTNQRMWPA